MSAHRTCTAGGLPSRPKQISPKPGHVSCALVVQCLYVTQWRSEDTPLPYALGEARKLLAVFLETVKGFASTLLAA